MNRDIKFRVWDGERMWSIATLRCFEDGTWLAYEEAERQGEDYVPWASLGSGRNGLEHPVLMQYTGLTDADGQEAFEGDIIEMKVTAVSRFWEIVFHEGSFCIQYQKPPHVVEYPSQWEIPSHELLHHALKNGRIVGNVYEHPHLLEEQMA